MKLICIRGATATPLKTWVKLLSAATPAVDSLPEWGKSPSYSLFTMENIRLLPKFQVVSTSCLSNNRKDASMTETFAEHNALLTWSAQECPFVIDYSRKTLDDIRLAVVDAFFSLPRGGAEIGGILLGRIEDNKVQILDYAPIECEHAFGPAFTLSPADQAKLAELLRQSFPGALRPVGWYHSHTRSEISLCEADLDIHNRYFPERWQVALVLRPSTLQPTQAGFFFREPDGSIHSQRSYQEFVVEPLPIQQIPAASGDAAPGPMRHTEPEAVVINLAPAEIAAPYQAAAEPPPAAEPPAPEPEGMLAEPVAPSVTESSYREFEHEPTPAPLLLAAPPAPSFAEPVEAPAEPPRTYEPEPQTAHEPADDAPSFTYGGEEETPSRRPWLVIAAALLAGMGLGVVIQSARSHSTVAAAVPARPAQTAAGPAAPAAQDPALLRQAEDLRKQVADLTQQNASLRADNAALTRQQADVTAQRAELNKQQGDQGKRQTELQQQRDDLARQTAKLKGDLASQSARAQSLQQQVDDLRRQLQRRRLSIQSSDPLP